MQDESIGEGSFMIVSPDKSKSNMSRSQPASEDTPILDHVIQNLLEELAAEGGRPVYTLTPAEARNTLLRTQSGPVHKPDAQVKDWSVQSGQYALRLRIVRPDNTTGRGPVIMYFHRRRLGDG